MPDPKEIVSKVSTPRTWLRSALLDSETCEACRQKDLTPISSPNEDLSKICKSKDGCRCLPIFVSQGAIAR